ncbi:MAG: hypothetical protein II931_00630 [Clostridia bacterium]|nr:hypothetical protein [Clostridia bacterium]
MKNKFKLLQNADDNIIEKLSDNYCDISQKEKDRIFAMSERKSEDMKVNAANISQHSAPLGSERPEIVEIEKHGTWYRPFGAAGVCLAAVTVIIGIAVFCHVSRIGRIDPVTEPIEDLTKGTADKGETEAASELYFGETGAVSAASEDSKDSGNSEHENASVSSAEPSSVSNEKTRCTDNAAASSAAEVNTQTTDEQDGTRCTEYEDLPSNPESQTSEAESETVGSSPVQIHYPLEEKTSYSDNEIQAYGTTTEDKILSISDDMTYDEAIGVLGEPDTLYITKGYAQFIVDNTKLLMIHYSDKNDIIGTDGNALLESCVELSELESDPDNLTFEGYIASCNGAVRVTCPQHSAFKCADLWLLSDFDKSSIKAGDKVKVSYYNDIMESYPCTIQVKEFAIE